MVKLYHFLLDRDEQSIDKVNNNSEKCSGIYVEQNIDVVNDNSDECSIVNVVADSQPVESLSFSGHGSCHGGGHGGGCEFH